MQKRDAENLTASIVEFGRFLRSHGFSADLRRTITALEAARAINVADKQSFACALQAALCSNREEWDRFSQLFVWFWGESHPPPRSAAGEHKGPSRSDPKEQGTGSSVFLDRQQQRTVAPDGEGKAGYGASAQQRLKKVDFSEIPFDDQKPLEDLSLRLLRRMSLRLSRRFKLSGRDDQIDLRRSIRRSIASGGDPIVLAYKARKPQKYKLVILLDVSGSMNFYSLFLVRFAYALQSCFRQVETFLFSTDVVRITDLLRTRSLPDALRRLSGRAAGWSGGTKIGESLRQLSKHHGGRLLKRETVLMLLSDGWETGDPQLLAAQMRIARRRVRRVLWLNPLLGLKDYQPVTRGMAAALPYVDVFASAHSLESLLALEKVL
jgi:uncharacterized protein with von Willebrand factor type A (vWA) domain